MSRDFFVSPFGPRIEVDSDGVWLVDGEPVVHPTVLEELVKRLDRRADGTYVIRAGRGELPIHVAGAPFVVRTLALGRGPDGRIAAIRGLLSDGSEETVAPSSVRRVGGAGDGERLACAVKEGRFEARLSRFATYQLLAAAEPAPDGRARLDLVSGPVVF